jgi:hypothetical protein
MSKNADYRIVHVTDPSFHQLARTCQERPARPISSLVSVESFAHLSFNLGRNPSRSGNLLLEAANVSDGGLFPFAYFVGPD